MLVVSPEKVVAAARSVLHTRLRAAASVAAPPQVLWTPNRNFVA
jgi:hypothetical protein